MHKQASWTLERGKTPVFDDVTSARGLDMHMPKVSQIFPIGYRQWYMQFD